MNTSDETKPVLVDKELEEQKGWLPAGLRAFLLPNRGAWFIPLYYLQIILLAEALTALSEPRTGLVLHGLTLMALLVQGALTRNMQRRRFLLALALAPLIRLLSLSLPLRGRPLVDWYMLVGALLFVAAYFTSRVIGFTGNRIGLTWGYLPLQIAFALVGVPLGFLEYLILRPPPLAEAFTFQAIWYPAFVLLVFTGLLEEVIFRGILQEASLGSYGLFGVNFVAITFAVLHLGYASFLDVLFVYGVAVLFGFVALRTRSLLGVSLAHGLTNISLFLIFPFLLGSEQPVTVPLPETTNTPTSVVFTLTPFQTATPMPTETVTEEMLTLSPQVGGDTSTPLSEPATNTVTPRIEPTLTICSPPPLGWVPYTVKSGDTLYSLSQIFGVSVYDLQTANCMGNNDVLRAGAVIFVPNVSTATLAPTVTFTLIPTRTNTLLPSDTPTFTQTPEPTFTPPTPPAPPPVP